MDNRRRWLLSLLQDVNKLCRDDGVKFDKKNSRRIAVIKRKLRRTDYKLKEGNLFLLFHKKKLSKLSKENKVLLVSSHIDCKKIRGNEGITWCFSKLESDELIRGTYDNSITNAAILSLMIEDKLPDNVMVVFTGDEEENSGGAKEVIKYLKKKNIKYEAVVLDVTYVGYEQGVDFTIENDFWKRNTAKKIVYTLERKKFNWLYVPEHKTELSRKLPRERIYSRSALMDESWEYDEKGIHCFSLCLPVDGEMHSNDGVLARICSYENYIEVLGLITNFGE